MNCRLPYQYFFEPCEAPSCNVDVKVVPDDTLSPRQIITKFSKGVNDSRVSDHGEGSYLTAEAGLTKSREIQDESLLGVILPDPSLDYSEFEEFSKKSAEQISKIISDSKSRSKTITPSAPTPPAPSAPTPPAPTPPASQS